MKPKRGGQGNGKSIAIIAVLGCLAGAALALIILGTPRSPVDLAHFLSGLFGQRSQ